MSIRVYNNRTDNAAVKDLLDLYGHFLNAVDKSKIKSISFEDDKIAVYGIESILLEHNTRENLPVSGIVRWFNKGSGAGQIRLHNSNISAWFYVCNFEGANSHYPEMVTNIKLNKGDEIEATISADADTYRDIGLTNLKLIKGA